jgi:DNA-binding NarL/FixJ family response regulator
MPNSPIHILLANHQPIIRSGLRSLLERESEFRVVAEAANGREAIVMADYKRPDIALLEMKLPLVNGIDVAKQIASKGASTKPVFLTAHTDEGYVNEAFKAGARGYVAEDSASSDLVRAVRATASGRLFLSPIISSQLLEPYVSTGTMSEREGDLWCLIAAAYDEDEIAAILKADVSQVRADSRALERFVRQDALPAALVSVFAKPNLSNSRVPA